MGYDDTRYTDKDINDEGLRQQYAKVTVHAVIQLPFAPTTADLAQLSASAAHEQYPRSHLWASLLRYCHTWTLDTVPPVFQQAPFAAVLQQAKLELYLSNATFMAAYNTSLDVEHEMAGVVESNELLSNQLQQSEAEKVAAVAAATEKAEIEKAALAEQVQKLRAQLRENGLEPPI
jgi:hypothetical protein